MSARESIDLTRREVDLLLERIERAEYAPRPRTRVVAAVPRRPLPRVLDPRAGGRLTRLACRVRRSQFAADLSRHGLLVGLLAAAAICISIQLATGGLR